MDFDGEAIIVRGTINGKPASFFFDSGFSGSILINDQLNVGPQAGTMMMQDFVTTFEVPTVKVKAVTLGKMKFDLKDQEIPQQPLGDLTKIYGRHIDAMLGLSQLSNYVFELNFQNKKMIFYPDAQVDISKRKPDNLKTFLIEMLPRGLDVINMDVAFGDQQMTLAFDTGNAFFMATYKEHLKAMGQFTQDTPDYMYLSGIASGATPSFDWWAHKFSIGGIPVDDAVFSVHDLPSSEIESGGTIGIQFIRNFNVTVDYRRRLLWFERIPAAKIELPKADVGINAYYEEAKDRWYVAIVTKDSPAAKAGIKKGDIILEVDGTDIRQMSAQKIKDILEGPPSSKVKIVLSRSGNLVRAELTRAYLINGTPPPGTN